MHVGMHRTSHLRRSDRPCMHAWASPSEEGRYGPSGLPPHLRRKLRDCSCTTIDIISELGSAGDCGSGGGGCSAVGAGSRGPVRAARRRPLHVVIDRLIRRSQRCTAGRPAARKQTRAQCAKTNARLCARSRGADVQGAPRGLRKARLHAGVPTLGVSISFAKESHRTTYSQAAHHTTPHHGVDLHRGRASRGDGPRSAFGGRGAGRAPLTNLKCCNAATLQVVC